MAIGAAYIVRRNSVPNVIGGRSSVGGGERRMLGDQGLRGRLRRSWCARGVTYFAVKSQRGSVYTRACSIRLVDETICMKIGMTVNLLCESVHEKDITRSEYMDGVETEKA